MNREIKFRAWRLLGDDGGRMETHEHENEVGDFLNEAMSAGMPLMQYTGLKDKNGVEIYEGDIVRALGVTKFEINDSKIGNIRRSRFTAEVRWSNISNGWVVGAENSFRLLGDIEVIGNIYENPELLK